MIEPIERGKGDVGWDPLAEFADELQSDHGEGCAACDDGGHGVGRERATESAAIHLLISADQPKLVGDQKVGGRNPIDEAIMALSQRRNADIACNHRYLLVPEDT